MKKKHRTTSKPVIPVIVRGVRPPRMAVSQLRPWFADVTAGDAISDGLRHPVDGHPRRFLRPVEPSRSRTAVDVAYRGRSRRMVVVNANRTRTRARLLASP